MSEIDKDIPKIPERLCITMTMTNMNMNDQRMEDTPVHMLKMKWDIVMMILIQSLMVIQMHTGILINNLRNNFVKIRIQTTYLT